MEREKRKPSGREKDEASIKLLEKLRDQLYSSNASTRRQAAFKLSWMQEDGLEILNEALFSNYPKSTKNSAAYGLRKMRGRMKKMALETFEKGLQHDDRATREVCRNALAMLGQKVQEKAPKQRPPTSGRFEIKEIPKKTKTSRKVFTRQTPARRRSTKDRKSP